MRGGGQNRYSPRSSLTRNTESRFKDVITEHIYNVHGQSVQALAKYPFHTAAKHNVSTSNKGEGCLQALQLAPCSMRPFRDRDHLLELRASQHTL